MYLEISGLKWAHSTNFTKPVSEYPAACSLEERDKSMLVFQIEDNNGNVLEDTRDNETQYIVRALVKKIWKNDVLHINCPETTQPFYIE